MSQQSTVDYVNVLEAEDGQWYFNAVAGNNEVVMTSETYTTKMDAMRGAQGVFPGVEIKDPANDDD